MNVITSGSEVIKTLPSGASFNIESLDGWDDLSSSQQAYLHVYMDTVGQTEMSRLTCGIRKDTIERWLQDPAFASCLDTIDLLFTDGLRALDYMESITNGKIRGRVLQARKAKGYEPKGSAAPKLIVSKGGLGNLLKELEG
jgi:hypothetical protein